MAQRFGRNRRRAAREEIAKLTAERDAVARERDKARDRALMAEGAVRSAKERAISQFVESLPEARHAMAQIKEELVRAMTPVLREHAQRLLDASRSIDPVPAFSAYQSQAVDAEMTVIRGAIPALQYNVALQPSFSYRRAS
jgi:vacuolar-type H+-ATPase subunit E/Vma4